MNRYLKTFLLAIMPALLACGGFFCANAPIDQGAERIIFAVNGDGTITATVGINYVGDAEDFSWVVPVPSPPTLGVAETASLDTLELITSPQISVPRNYCDNIFSYPPDMGGGGGDGYLETGQVGPYDYAIIRNEEPGEMIAWLRDNGYQVTEAMEPLIMHYADAGMYFLAMRLQRGMDTSAIQPVVMTYESEKPMIPIILTAVAAVPNMPIITWIFGATQYVPENFANPRPDFARFRAPGELTGPTIANYFHFTGMSDYIVERDRIQRQYDGKAFITEYAGSTQILKDLGDPYLEALVERYPYLTRLRAQMSPEQMTLDPVFAPAPDAPDVSNNVSLGDYVDPLEYWECSSRAALENVDTASLPPRWLRLDDLRLQLALPDDWQQSEFTYQGREFLAFSPWRVTAQTLTSFLNDDPVSPALLVSGFDFYGTMGLSQDAEMIEFVFGSDSSFVLPDRNRLELRVRYNPVDEMMGGYGDAQGILLGLMTSPEDWQTHKTLYRAMLAYADSYQYFLSAEMPHTLFLRPFQNQFYSVGVPYPDGWREHTTDEGDFLISRGDGTEVHLVNSGRFKQNLNEGREVTAQRVIDWLIAETNLPRETIEQWFVNDSLSGYCDAERISEPLPFEHRGLKGYVRFLSGVIVIGYAPAGTFATHDATLRAMLNGTTAFACPGT
jgi:hypothetical protein